MIRFSLPRQGLVHWAEMRIAHISDSHLSSQAPFADANWNAIVDHLVTDPVDVVVHTGDISLNGATDVQDLAHSRRQLDRLPGPCLVLPGNHDIGDCNDDEHPVDARRRRRFGDIVGPTSWVEIFGTWRLVGVDAQTLLNDEPASRELWAWLADVLVPTDRNVTNGSDDSSESGDASSPSTHTALFMHRPLQPFSSGEADEPHRYVVEPARARLRELLVAAGVRLVASGHVHQWRRIDHDGIAHVWAPSCWATLPDHIQPVIGSKISGFVEYELGDDGQVATRLVQPGGLRQVTIGDDFASPY